MEENVIQIKSGIMTSVGVSIIILTYTTCSCENAKYLASIIDDSVIRCDEIIDADAEPKSYNNNKSKDE